MRNRFLKGYFMRPTVITGLRPNSCCVQEEIFGPVIVILPFTSTVEVINEANG